jgi:hypothetical protein
MTSKEVEMVFPFSKGPSVGCYHNGVLSIRIHFSTPL